MVEIGRVLDILERVPLFIHMSEFSSKDFEILALKMDQVHERQAETSKKVSDIRDKVLNPTTGLYPKVVEADVKATSAMHQLNGVKRDIDKLVGVCSNTKQRTTLIESWMDDHEQRDNELRDHVKKIAKGLNPVVDDYKIRMSRRRWTDKVLWLLVSGAIIASLATVKALFIDSDSSSERLDKIEEKLKR